MEKGDIVSCFDGSGSLKLKNGEIVDTGNICSGKVYEIIGTDLKLPADILFEERFNDTIVKELTDKEVIFTQMQYLRLYHRCNKCPHCGKKF